LTVHSPEQITSLGIIPEHDQTEIKIAAVLPGSPAAKAKLKRADIIVALDETPVPNRDMLRTALSKHKVGDLVTLKIKRAGKEQSASLTLGSAHLRLPVTEPMIGKTTASMIVTPPSIRRSGFPETLVHDLVIEHWQNGSPICDSRGRVVGINIATVTYDRILALPVSTIKQAINRMLTSPVSF
jgi:S1-C subfamily serine protease